jgi:hypothetical protein
MNKGRLTVLISILALMVTVVIPVRADEGVQATLTPDRGELTVGDPIQLTLEVNHPTGYQVIIPQLDQIWGELEVRGQSQATTAANDDGTETTRQTIEVTLFDVGEFQTPSLPLTISDGAGQVTQELMAPISLTVVPTLAEEDNELRDIKPQASLAVPPVWPWIVGGLLVAVIVGLAGWSAYRRWRGEPLFAPVVDNRPPWQVAYDELTRIEGLGLLEQGRFKQYYTLVTDCLRAYLERQFDLRVFDRTTSELKATLRRSDLAPDHTRQLLDLFMESDLVKFAKFTPDVNVARQLVDGARQFVDLTKPAPELESLLTGDPPPAAPVATSQLSYQSGQ